MIPKYQGQQSEMAEKHGPGRRGAAAPAQFCGRDFRGTRPIPRRASTLIFALLAILAVVAITSSCSRSGNFGTFIVSEVTKHGGHAVTNQPIPILKAHWTVKSDENGFQAFVTGASFASIDSVMRRSFGEPKISINADASGQPHLTWAAVDIGVAIQIMGRTDGAEIICVRGMRDMREMFEKVSGR
ncbi:MAG TPA: hypothetical protein VMZ27_17205 [Candidatus Saccharimonadales bacterium]|nr:hypothetical protein [Candidatus Saccharimonadales bacterium]